MQPDPMEKINKKIASNHFIRLLSDSSYLSFSLSVFLSQIAANTLTIVLIFLIFHITSSNFSVSILLFSILIPQIFISFLGGIMADIYNKKTIIIAGNVLRALALLIIFFNYKNTLVIYSTAFLISSITQFYVPAESSLIPTLVKREMLVAANSIFGVSFFGSILIGYVFAGPAITIFGRANVFLLLAGIFIIAALCAIFIQTKKIKNFAEKIMSPSYVKKSISQEFKESFLLLKKNGKVKDAFFLLIFSQIIIFILATLIPGYAKNILQIPAEDVSVILFAPAAIGMVIAAFLLGSILNKYPKRRLMSIGIFISGAVLMLFPATSKLVARELIEIINSFLPMLFAVNIFNLVFILALFAGLANALIFVPSQAIIQETIPHNFTSKIYGLLFSLIGIFSIPPIMIAGGVADAVGVGAVLLWIGLSIIVIGLLREKILQPLVSIFFIK